MCHPLLILSSVYCYINFIFCTIYVCKTSKRLTWCMLWRPTWMRVLLQPHILIIINQQVPTILIWDSHVPTIFPHDIPLCSHMTILCSDMNIPKFPQAHSYIPIRACSHIVHQKHTQRGAKSSKIIYRDQNQYLTIRKALLYIELVEAKILSGRKMRENDSRFSSRGVESWAAKDPSYSNPGWLSRPCRRNYNNWV